MPKTLRRTIVKDGKKVEVIEPEDLELEWDGPPPDPSWKHLKTDLILRDLKELTQSVKEQLNSIRSEMNPTSRSIIRWYLGCVDEILMQYEFYYSCDVSPGRPRRQAERAIAKEVVQDFQKLQHDATRFPTGQYLHDQMTLINEDRLSTGREALNFSLRGCDKWISEMREGTFDPPPVEDFF